MGLMDGARTTVGTCLNVKKKDRVLIVSDDNTARIGEALYNASLEKSLNTVLVRVSPESLNGREPGPILVEAMKQSTVVIAPTTYSITHTRAITLAANRGARIATMPGITARMMGKGAMTADFRKIAKLMNKVYRVVRRPKNVRITTELGTDLTMDLKGRRWITDDVGLCHRPKQVTNLPAGEIFIAPVEGSTQGKLIADGSFHGLLERPVEIEINEGVATKIVYAPHILREMNEGGRSCFVVAELGVGLNDAARVIGNVLQDGKALGTVHISFGDNSTFGGKNQAPFNRDAVITKPTLEINDRLILERGELKL